MRTRSFWGAMASAIIGGLFAATLLTLLLPPVLYAAWFPIKEPADERQVAVTTPAAGAGPLRRNFATGDPAGEAPLGWTGAGKQAHFNDTAGGDHGKCAGK